MTDRWVFNASPLILLGKAGELHWLPRLGELAIPQAVAHEIAAGSKDDPARQWLATGDGQRFVHADATASDDLRAWDLGPGETAVVAWARQHADVEAVLDDAAARACAGVYGIRVRGTLSLVALAKRRGFIGACRPVFARLTAAGLFVTPALMEQVAKAAGE